MSLAEPAPLPTQDITCPLAVFEGARPEAPGWFTAALQDVPERSSVVVAGVPIETLVWGPRGAPGLVLLHGHGAHADWWSFLAPFLAKERRVLALSWSGMGGSGWRETYSVALFVREVLETLQACGLEEGPGKPVLAAHSFGGGIAAAVAATHGDRFERVIIIDHGAQPPEEAWRGPPARTQGHRVYPDLTAALARFRLMPPQGCANAYILDYIARAALKPAPLDPDRPDLGSGFTWRFDPFIWPKMEARPALQSAERLRAARCPLAFVWGAQSSIMRPSVVAYSRQHAPEGTPFIEIPDAEHHVLLDRPLALISVLRTLLASAP